MLVLVAFAGFIYHLQTQVTENVRKKGEIDTRSGVAQQKLLNLIDRYERATGYKYVKYAEWVEWETDEEQNIRAMGGLLEELEANHSYVRLHIGDAEERLTRFEEIVREASNSANATDR